MTRLRTTTRSRPRGVGAGVGVLALVLLAGTGGCMVRSLHPFHAGEFEPPPSVLDGEWRLVRQPEVTRWMAPAARWSVRGERIEIHEDGGLVARLRGRVFRAGGRLLMDVAPSEVDTKRVSAWWAGLVVPAHTLVRLEPGGDRLVAIPLDEEWLAGAARAGAVPVAPALGPRDGDLDVYAATPAQWEALLAAHARDPRAFPREQRFELERAR